MIKCGKLLFKRHLVSGWGGNLSCRLGENELLITGRHAPLGFLTTADLVRIDGAGRSLNRDQLASSETPLHLAVYAATGAQAIVHVHPPMVLAFSLSHDHFVPISFEEKYTIGEVPIVAQDTPTVTKPENLADQLKYRPVVILKGHGTVAIGKDFQEAFLFTDLLEEAVRCRFFTQLRSESNVSIADQATQQKVLAEAQTGKSYVLFSKEHMSALVECANHDSQFRSQGKETGLSTSLTLLLEEKDTAWTVRFECGQITQLDSDDRGEFMISGPEEWWSAVFQARIDPFLATQQGKLKLKRGELAQLARWYKPFERAFSLWRTVLIQ
ncbi:MAG TPA: class II aldolase/adducin family protein [Candidatus Binatia bacterium]